WEVIHIATHGFYWNNSDAIQHSDYRPSFIKGTESDMPKEDKALTRSGLLFAGAQNSFLRKEIPWGVEDGILTAKEISRLDLRKTNLVVISACQSGIGEVTGDGVLGLQRGFKKAGVQSIIMSLWDVDDEATRIMMTRFYESLSKGQKKYAAFRDAQSYLREYKKGIYNKPAYYAAFVLLDAIQ
ncbi:MAG: CHAT domain-containing protein, partial [Bacteroidales bacterium]|nr:CHAT domain-containing protein [Bacteroidales bacterium]